MAESESKAQYKQEFMARVAQARIARGMKQWEMAEALDMPQDQFKQYETRSLMPHHLIGRFCLICRIEMKWLLTGHGDKAIKQLAVTEPAQSAPKKPRQARSKRAAA